MNKKFKVTTTEEFDKQFQNVPDEVAESIEKLIKGFKTGKINPKKVGTKLKQCEIKLICESCDSKNVSWLLDKNSNEVYFTCKDCGKTYWMTLKEYNKAIKKFPECII